MSSQNQFIALLLLSIVSIQGIVLERKVELLSSKDVEGLINSTAIACGVPDDSFDSFESLFNLKFNGTKLQELKCSLGCMLKNFGWITDDNEFDRKGFFDFVDSIPDVWFDENEDEWESCDTDLFEEKCATLKADNECELAWNFFHCMESICVVKEGETANDSKEEPTN